MTSYIYLLNLPPWKEVMEVKKSRNLVQNKASGGNFPDFEPGLRYYRVTSVILTDLGPAGDDEVSDTPYIGCTHEIIIPWNRGLRSHTNIILP